eukprot:6792066-Prymnesium_polylepis.1
MYVERGLRSLGNRQARTLLRIRNQGRGATLLQNRTVQRQWLDDKGMQVESDRLSERGELYT